MVTEVDDKTYCTTCGAYYDPRAKYCGVDGTALKKATEMQKSPATAAKKRCPTCTTLYPIHAQYCPIDAAKLAELAQPNNVSRTEVIYDFARYTGADEKPGQVFANKYRIERLLGEGGMAKVYLATHLEIEKSVVIKLMRNQLSSRDKETTLKRFLQEIKVTAKLNHPNLVSVFDGGEVDGRPYLVMEYIKGELLRQYISMEGPLPFEVAINIICQVCSGLQEAHNEGVIHRDLKPENIMLREDIDRPDWVKVVDFGIAHLKHGGSKLTATGIAIGTVDYMSPEYLSDRPIDHRADIYAVGVILHELLTGKCPFESEAPEAVMAKHLWSNPMPPSSSRSDMKSGCALDAIVDRALQKEPNDRYQTANEMRKALQACLANPAG
jgi:serine/threonine-protein kinase